MCLLSTGTIRLKRLNKIERKTNKNREKWKKLRLMKYSYKRFFLCLYFLSDEKLCNQLMSSWQKYFYISLTVMNVFRRKSIILFFYQLELFFISKKKSFLHAKDLELCFSSFHCEKILKKKNSLAIKFLSMIFRFLYLVLPKELS